MKNKQDEFSPRFYRFIDSPIRIFLFEIDDLIVGVLALWVLVFSSWALEVGSGGFLYLYIVMAILTSVWYSKFKKNKPKGYLFQILYKSGLYFPGNKIAIKSRKYIRYGKDYKVAPKYFTKELRGQ